MGSYNNTLYLLVLPTGLYRGLVNSYMIPVYGSSALDSFEIWILDLAIVMLTYYLLTLDRVRRQHLQPSCRSRLLKCIIAVLGCGTSMMKT